MGRSKLPSQTRPLPLLQDHVQLLHIRDERSSVPIQESTTTGLSTLGKLSIRSFATKHNTPETEQYTAR